MRSATSLLHACAVLGPVVLLSACAHEPISKPFRQEARRGVTVRAVQEDPAAFKGAVVIWGGEVIKTVPTSIGSDLFVLQLPLTSDERPSGQTSEGRFIAHSPSFLDPRVYREGRRVTVAGEIEGIKPERIGNAEYPYPVLDVKQMVIWRRAERYYGSWGLYGWPYYWGPPGFGWYGWGDDWGDDWGDEGDDD